MHLDNSEGRCRFSHAEWSWFPSRDTLVRYPGPLCAHSFLVYSVEMHGAQRRGSPAVSVQQLHSTETKSKSSRLKDSTALLSRPSGNSFVSTILTSYFYVVCGTNITSCPECGHICSKKVFWLHSLNHFFFDHAAFFWVPLCLRLCHLWVVMCSQGTLRLVNRGDRKAWERMKQSDLGATLLPKLYWPGPATELYRTL